MFSFHPPFSHGFISHNVLFIAVWLLAIQSLFCILHKIWCLHNKKNWFVFYKKASIWCVFIEACFLDEREVLIGNWEREEFGVSRQKYGFS